MGNGEHVCLCPDVVRLHHLLVLMGGGIQQQIESQRFPDIIIPYYGVTLIWKMLMDYPFLGLTLLL